MNIFAKIDLVIIYDETWALIQYKDFILPSHLYNGNSYTGTTVSLYQKDPWLLIGETSQQGPPFRVVLNERWPFIRGKINMNFKILCLQNEKICVFWCDFPSLFADQINQYIHE